MLGDSSALSEIFTTVIKLFAVCFVESFKKSALRSQLEEQCSIAAMRTALCCKE